MKPTADPYFKRKSQRQLLDDKVRLLTEFIDLQHPLVLLANRIQWSDFDVVKLFSTTQLRGIL